MDAYTAFVLHLVASQAKVPRATMENGIRVLFNKAFVRRRNLAKIDAFHDDLVRLIKAIAPRCVVPIHSNTPELFADCVENVRLLNDGERFSIP